MIRKSHDKGMKKLTEIFLCIVVTLALLALVFWALDKYQNTNEYKIETDPREDLYIIPIK